MRRRRAGVTLIELLVVLTLLGIFATLSTLAVGSLLRPRSTEFATAADSMRRIAIHQGVELVMRDSAGRAVLLLPDGRVIGAGFDALTGAYRVSR